MDRLGNPLEGRNAEPVVSMDDILANKSTIGYITEYVCDCYQPVAKERASNGDLSWPSCVATAGTTSGRPFPIVESVACIPQYTRESSTLTACPMAGTGPDPRPYWNSTCDGCTARFASINKDERKKHQGWERVEHNGRWIMEIIISSSNVYWTRRSGR